MKVCDGAKCVGNVSLPCFNFVQLSAQTECVRLSHHVSSALIAKLVDKIIVESADVVHVSVRRVNEHRHSSV